MLKIYRKRSAYMSQLPSVIEEQLAVLPSTVFGLNNQNIISLKKGQPLHTCSSTTCPPLCPHQPQVLPGCQDWRPRDQAEDIQLNAFLPHPPQPRAEVARLLLSSLDTSVLFQSTVSTSLIFLWPPGIKFAYSCVLGFSASILLSLTIQPTALHILRHFPAAC